MELFTIILVIILVVVFWSTLTVIRHSLNSIMQKGSVAIDHTVTVLALENEIELQVRAKNAIAQIEASGESVNFNELSKLYLQPK